MTVSGLTMTSAVRHAVHECDRYTHSHRSAAASRNRRGRDSIEYLKLVPQGEDLKL